MAVIGVRMWGGAVVEAARRLAEAVRPRAIVAPVPDKLPEPLKPLIRVRLADEVARTLFAEYAAHLAGERGDEETGWALLGYRDGDSATVVATLPAGAERQAGAAHVRFNPEAQALGSRIVRQADKRLALLGVAHTHPGSLRRPSDGDYRGDVQWVRQLRGGTGVFGIGTADAADDPQPGVLWQPRPHRQCQGGLSWSWYSLAAGERGYHPLPVELTLGPDLALPMRPVWDVIETHAERLDRLTRQLNRVSFSVVAGKSGPALAVNVPLAEPESAVRVLLEGKEVRYLLLQGDDVLAADLPESRVDQGVFLLLAELAARPRDAE